LCWVLDVLFSVFGCFFFFFKNKSVIRKRNSSNYHNNHSKHAVTQMGATPEPSIA